mgnify:CR=1 FL=1
MKDHKMSSQADIRKDRLLLQNPYAHLNPEGRFSCAVATPTRYDLQNPYAYLNGAGKFDSEVVATTIAPSPHIFYFGPQRASVEKSAHALQRELWKHRKSIFGSTEVKPLTVIDPKAAATILGLTMEEVNPLPWATNESGNFEVAGLFNRAEKRISISNRLPRSTWRFTASHELGHYILHPGVVELHRDKPLDGSEDVLAPNAVERQANWFAAAFLMPQKLVTQEFVARFGTALPLKISKDIAFGLARGRYLELLPPKITAKKLAFELASSIYFHGESFESLTTVFSVSTSAMAYRLLELGLIDTQALKTA